MSLPNDLYMNTRWAMNLEELDREIARLALICRVRLLDTGVIERVLRDQSWVSAADNPYAFRKLRQLLLTHFALMERQSAAMGRTQAAGIEQYVVERLRKSFPELGAPQQEDDRATG